MDKSRMKRIAIIGATGFTGSELVRILHRHPDVEIALITSESRAGEKFSEVHPFFQGIVDQVLQPVSRFGEYDIDLAFLALPHGISMDFVKSMQSYDIPLVDLSGDFRLSGPEVYTSWYEKEHIFPEGFKNAAYGLPELFSEKIRSAQLVANPGCYPTSVILAAAPLLREGLADPGHVIADSKSGVTGAGVKAKAVNHFSNVNDNFKAYALKSHRHTIEIEEKLNLISGRQSTVQFTPHLLPVDRGILSTVYLRPTGMGTADLTGDHLQNLYKDFYSKAPFVRVREDVPSLKEVRGTNFCDIHPVYDQRTGNIIVVSVIDNLVKGAAGQAVQNMNIIFGWDETAGLDQVPMCP